MNQFIMVLLMMIPSQGLVHMPQPVILADRSACEKVGSVMYHGRERDEENNIIVRRVFCLPVTPGPERQPFLVPPDAWSWPWDEKSELPTRPKPRPANPS